MSVTPGASSSTALAIRELYGAYEEFNQPVFTPGTGWLTRRADKVIFGRSLKTMPANVLFSRFSPVDGACHLYNPNLSEYPVEEERQN